MVTDKQESDVFRDSLRTKKVYIAASYYTWLVIIISPSYLIGDFTLPLIRIIKDRFSTSTEHKKILTIHFWLVLILRPKYGSMYLLSLFKFTQLKKRKRP